MLVEITFKGSNSFCMSAHSHRIRPYPVIDSSLHTEVPYLE